MWKRHIAWTACACVFALTSMASAANITFDEVPRWGGGDPSSFQIILNETGSIEVHFVVVETDNYITGISNGVGNAVPPETDFVP